MPIREYECHCGHAFERIEQRDRKSARWCPKCGRRTAHRKVSTVNHKFKGAGFHVNDYPKPNKNHNILRADNIQRGVERSTRRMEKLKREGLA